MLSRLLAAKESAGIIHGIKISRNAPPILHLFFADDVMCFCLARPSELAAVKWCIETFSRWSGLKVNEKKSDLFWSKNFWWADQRRCSQVWPLRRLGMDAVYLGNRLFIGENKKMAFEGLRQKVLGGKLNGWRSKLLSSAGRGTLIKSVVSSMPFYGMSTFLIPKEICKEMDRMVGKIWWRGEVAEGRCWCPRSCDSVCQPKVFGGLGFRRFHDINCALVAKLGWKLQVDGNSLWVKALRAKYITSSDFINCCPSLDRCRVYEGEKVALGLVIRDSNTNVLQTIGFYGPPVSPEVAEPAAVIKAVEAAIQEGWWKNVLVERDCQNVINATQGKVEDISWQTRDYILKARRLADYFAFTAISFHWVHRGAKVVAHSVASWPFGICLLRISL
ncbi:hypothetical protein TIFTF001_028054 [Ficus carica]|uniref:RNase H type-1 domain-containing protein n=1 Tax=Ficus carica TaxID=3494 RepID=A0AA88DPJ8_FICCA|nr:hypothetical protein TIFTF001_028054 [Ficus carica]